MTMVSCTKFPREDDKVCHTQAVPVTFNKYVLHQAHNALGHNGIAWMYWFLKQLYY